MEDYYLTRASWVELTLNSEIDRRAMSLLFDTVAQGQSSLWLGTISHMQKNIPKLLMMRCLVGRVSYRLM